MEDNYKEYYRRIGLKVAYYRRLKGLTQDELASAIGRCASTIRMLEAPNQNNKSCSLSILFDIAKVLNIKVYKLFTDV